MINVVNMSEEIVEAIKEYYKNDEETAVDCLLYLAETKVLPLGYVIYRTLNRMGRCIECGNKLKSYTYTQYHDELDEPPMRELITETYCPQCDVVAGGAY